MFLDQVTVIPPGEWDPNTRLEPPQKIPQREERLDRISQLNKINSIPISGSNHMDDEIKPHSLGSGLEFTGK